MTHFPASWRMQRVLEARAPSPMVQRLAQQYIAAMAKAAAAKQPEPPKE